MKWLEKIGNWLHIPSSKVKPFVCFMWGYGNTPNKPNFRNFRILWWEDARTRSLYMNGVVFFRFSFPFYVGLQLKVQRDYRFQTGLGWKLNGDFAVTFRYQSTESAARGYRFPNVGQAEGWMDGDT